MMTMDANDKVSPYYLRITAFPGCNLKCVYCNPNADFDTAIMPDNELLEIIKAAHQQGIRTVHFTGGEPTLRPHFVELVNSTKDIGMTTIDLTTNGVMFNGMAEELARAGLTGASISIDSLIKEKVNKITSRDVFYPVYESIVKSCDLFKNVVANMVVMPENIEEIPDFIDFSRQMKGKFIPRFCELQNYGPAYEGMPEKFKADYISKDQILNQLKKCGPVETRDRQKIDKHNAHAEYFILCDELVVGIIAPYSAGWPCAREDCSRIRIGPLGTAKSCLISSTYQLNGHTYEEKLDMMTRIIAEKDYRKMKGTFPTNHVPAYKELRFGQP